MRVEKNKLGLIHRVFLLFHLVLKKKKKNSKWFPRLKPKCIWRTSTFVPKIGLNFCKYDLKYDRVVISLSAATAKFDVGLGGPKKRNFGG